MSELPDPQAASGHDEAPQDEALRYVNEIARARGYVLPYHKLMARADIAALQAANGLVDATYLQERTLDRKTKELLFVLSLTVMRAAPGQIASHIRVALEVGATPTEVLEAIEIALPEAGIVAFQHGFEVWADVVGVQGIEPTIAINPD